MEIVVAVKPVPDAEAKLRATSDHRAFDPEGVKFVLAGYDESAVEQALLLKEGNPPSRVTAVVLGPPARSEEVLRSCLALGCDAARCVDAPEVAALSDPLRVARGISDALRGGHADLILFGKQAGDDEEGLVGSAVAQLLGVGYLGFVTDLRWDPARSRFVLKRPTESGEESWAAPAPLAIALQQAWNDPRTAKLPAILKSRKVVIEHLTPAAPTPSVGSAEVEFALPPPRSGAKILEYKTPQEAAEKLVRVLREEAKVFP